MKKVSFLIFAILFLIIWVFPSSLFEEGRNIFDYARITDIDYQAVVVDEPGSHGKVVITERLTFDIHAASRSNLFWELWRDLPESYVDGVKVEYQVNSVKQILDDKTEVIYDQSPQLYWEDGDYVSQNSFLGPGKWFHSKGPYNEDARQYECVLFYVDGLYRETVVFEIEYEMVNASLRYNDCSELYLALYGGNTIKHLESVKGQILIPEELMPETGNYYAYTYGTNANEFPFTESKTVNPGYHSFLFELNQSQLSFRPYNRYIEFDLVAYGEDKHRFTQYASVNDYSHEDVLNELREAQTAFITLPGTFFLIKAVLFFVFMAGTGVTIVLTLLYDNRIRRKHNFFKPRNTVDHFWGMPSELDPGFAAALVFCKHRKSDRLHDGYTAVLLSLVRKGYIELAKIYQSKDWNPDNVKIDVKYRPGQVPTPMPEAEPGQYQPYQDISNLPPLTPTEELYFNLIIRHSHGLDISMDMFQQQVAEDHEHTNAFVRSVKNTINHIGLQQGYFQLAQVDKLKEKTRKIALRLGVVGFLLLIAGNLISYQTRLDLIYGSIFILGLSLIASAFYLHKAAPKYILLTQQGEDEYAKWRGYYNYLKSSQMDQRTMNDSVMWEHNLIYATAFGIADNVISVLRIRPEETSASPVLRNPYYRSRHFHSHGHSFRSATHGVYSGGGGGGLFVHGDGAGDAVHALPEKVFGEVPGFALHILRHGDGDRARQRGIGEDAHGVDEGGHEHFRPRHPIPVAADGFERVVRRPRQIVRVLKLLEDGVGLAAGEGVAGEEEEGDVVDAGDGGGGDHVGGAGADGGHAGDDAFPVVLLGEAGGRVRHALLVLALVDFQAARVLVQRLPDPEDEAVAEGGEDAGHVLVLDAVEGDVLVVEKFHQRLAGRHADACHVISSSGMRRN